MLIAFQDEAYHVKDKDRRDENPHASAESDFQVLKVQGVYFIFIYTNAHVCYE